MTPPILATTAPGKKRPPPRLTERPVTGNDVSMLSPADPFTSPVAVAPLQHRSPLCRAAGLLLAGLARLLSGASVRWIASQPDTCQRIYFANHTSHLDALVIWASLPPSIRDITRPVAAKDYWSRGLIRRWLALLCLLAAPAWAQPVQPPVHLQLTSEHPVQGMTNGNLSGLAWCGDALWAVSDRDDNRLYRLDASQPGYKQLMLGIGDALRDAGVPYIFATGGGDEIPAIHAGAPTLSKPYTMASLESVIAAL